MLLPQLIGVAMVAVSLFNSILLLWMGLTVLLNARTRSWGNWLAALGLLLGGAFFVAHTASLDYSLETLVERSPAWWLTLSLPLLALPFGWLVLMLWYCGYWDSKNNSLRRWSRWPYYWCLASVPVLLLAALFSAPRGHRIPGVSLLWESYMPFLGMRLLLLTYPVFLVVCTATALYALLHPAPSGRLMREEARRRARPWLVASSLVQLLVSIGVSGGLGFIAYQSRDYAIFNLVGALGFHLNTIDLITSSMVGLAVMLLGKAVVSYEIFTEKVLPRRGFWHQWRSVVLLAGLYSTLLSLLAVPPWYGTTLNPTYPLLFSTCVMSLFLAFNSHRSYEERARAVADLRPFVASQHLYASLLSGKPDLTDRTMNEPFYALCREVLGTRAACLIPCGQLANLAGGPRLFPAGTPMRASWQAYASNVSSSAGPFVALPPESDMAWLVPLGDANEPLGVLLLGEKWDGSLYTQEEMEIARSAGEHLLDAQAGATLAGRLMSLQRHRLAEIQTLDRRARRILHDDILPQVHAALLELGAQGAPQACQETLAQVHKQISNLLREMPIEASPLARRNLLEALQHEVKVEHSENFDKVEWEVSPQACQAMELLSPLAAETLFFAAREVLRNAGKYCRRSEDGTPLTLSLRARVQDQLELTVADNGGGMVHGTAVPETNSSGHGLELHGTLMAVIGGQLTVTHLPWGGVSVLLSVPVPPGLAEKAGSTKLNQGNIQG